MHDHISCMFIVLGSFVWNAIYIYTCIAKHHTSGIVMGVEYYN